MIDCATRRVRPAEAPSRTQSSEVVLNEMSKHTVNHVSAECDAIFPHSDIERWKEMEML
jgi:hypothetical protein